jgi:predicted DCC family thiol-disulfide oxidoreductase YuxK
VNATKAITPGQFALFRIIFGVYLFQHFLWLLPVGPEVFSNTGVLADPRLNATYALWPNPLATTWGGTPAFVTGFLAVLAGLSVLFTLGVWRRAAALLLWFGWACLFNRNNLISNPGLPYVGLILLGCVLVPEAESLRWKGRERPAADWFFPQWLFRGVWFLMTAGYTFSGLLKLQSPSWVDGTAFHHLIDNPLARPGFFRDLFLGFPPGVIALFTWSVLAAEITFLPLSLFRLGRAAAWTGMLVMHLGIILMVDFADLSFGMVMLHLFTFDPDWLPVRRDARQPVLFYDGECGLCNFVVRFLLREDGPGRMHFAPLQSAPAEAYLRAQGLPTEDFDSLVFVPDWRRQEPGAYQLRTTGVLRAADEIGGVWRVLSWLRVLPGWLRDPFYKLVARLRYVLFGEFHGEPLAKSKEWGGRFLG